MHFDFDESDDVNDIQGGKEIQHLQDQFRVALEQLDSFPDMYDQKT
jgi:hypothetical protein